MPDAKRPGQCLGADAWRPARGMAPGRRWRPAVAIPVWRAVVAAPAIALVTAGLALAQPTVRTDEPRAFGYTVGSTFVRDVHLTLPDGLSLDETSLPPPGRRGGHLELRSIERTRTSLGGVAGEHLRMTYQVFLAPTEVRTLEIAPFRLRFLGTPAGQELRVEAWPITVAPLVPVAVSPRTGLGEWRPDQAPVPLDEQGHRQRLLALVGAAAGVGLYLLHVFVGLPWLARRQRPFALAWNAVQPLTAAGQAPGELDGWPQALQALHAALNRTAGRTLFAADVEAFVAEHPRLRPLRDDLAAFFETSRRAFFLAPGAAPTPDDVHRLRELARRCRDVERGTA